ncbi:MAG: hypothetical protein CMN31_11900 [Sandaracinus sp.]|nr:hypothetical protein [Myxococcales bacterium]MAT24714.1 hypothetical protein [Sandaracinus sp.]MBJ72023.1 hypothetical protein [Sandaracinus sp.]
MATRARALSPNDGRSVRASKKRESRRKAILQAARRAFAEKGYHHTHVADIIAGAGIARGTFYLYFESKNAIFLELLDQLLDELQASIVGVDTEEGAPPVEAQLVDRVQQILGLVVQNRALTRILVREAVGLDADVDRRLHEFYGSLLEYIRDALENGKRMGFLRELDTEVAAFCVLGTIKQFMEQLVMSEDDHLAENVDRLALQVLDFNLRGLLKS